MKLLKVAEVAEITRLSEITIYKWAEDGRIPSFRLGNRVRFDRDEIMEWLRRQRRENGNEKVVKTAFFGL